MAVTARRLGALGWSAFILGPCVLGLLILGALVLSALMVGAFILGTWVISRGILGAWVISRSVLSAVVGSGGWLFCIFKVLSRRFIQGHDRLLLLLLCWGFPVEVAGVLKGTT